MTETTHQGGPELLAAIIATPADTELRLRYAAWLEQRGDPRGAFIRAQCLLAEGNLSRNEAAAQRQIVQDLVRAHMESWWIGRRQDGWSGSGTRFEDWKKNRAWSRGFQEAIRLGTDELIASGNELFATTPVRKLILEVDTADELERALECESLTGLHSLEIYYHPPIGVAGARALAHSPRLRALIELEAVECAFDPAAAAALASSPHLRTLRRLNLSQNPLGDAGVAALVDSPICAGLTELWLPRCEIGDRGAEAIAASPHLQNLLVNDIGRPGASALVNSPNLRSLKTLNLRFNRIQSKPPRRIGLTVLLSGS